MTGCDQEMRTDATRTVCFDGKPLVSATGPCMQCSGSVILHKPIIPPQEVESDLAKGTDSFFFKNSQGISRMYLPAMHSNFTETHRGGQRDSCNRLMM